jgi:DNA repair exonuclease SbcCD ATPase subunit
MAHVGRVCLGILFVLSTITGCVARSDFEKVQSDLFANQSQLQTSQSEYNKLKSEHERLIGEHEALSGDNAELVAQHEKLQTDFKALSREKQALEDQLKAAKAKQSTAELRENSAKVSLKVLQNKVDKARVKAEILDLIFSRVSKYIFGGTSLTTRAETVDMGLKLTKLIAEADDPALDEKFTELMNHPNDQLVSFEFFIYLVADIYKNLK